MRISGSLLFLVAAAFSAAATAQSMKPGLWEISTQMSGDGMPAMPAIPEAERKQMEALGIKMPGAAGSPMNMTVRHCVTPEAAEKRLPPQTEEDKRQRCEHKDVKSSGSTVTWTIECKGEHKMTGNGSITYEGADRYRGQSTFNMSEAAHGAMSMKQNFTGKWLAAACN